MNVKYLPSTKKFGELLSKSREKLPSTFIVSEDYDSVTEACTPDRTCSDDFYLLHMERKIALHEKGHTGFMGNEVL